MAEFKTDEVRRRYRHKLGLRERIGSGHYLYEIVSPAGIRIGRTAMPRGAPRSASRYGPGSPGNSGFPPVTGTT